ncbi:MAG: hypothetical protein AB1426_06795 [Bacillota bacterium]
MRSICFQLVGDIPVVGPLWRDPEAARRFIERWIKRYESVSIKRCNIRLLVIRRGVHYSLAVAVDGSVIFRLNGLNELLLRRLVRAVQRKQVFILSPFVSGFPEPQPFVLTGGLGLVIIQQPAACRFNC